MVDFGRKSFFLLPWKFILRIFHAWIVIGNPSSLTLPLSERGSAPRKLATETAAPHCYQPPSRRRMWLVRECSRVCASTVAESERMKFCQLPLWSRSHCCWRLLETLCNVPRSCCVSRSKRSSRINVSSVAFLAPRRGSDRAGGLVITSVPFSAPLAIRSISSSAILTTCRMATSCRRLLITPPQR